jgi:methylmalonyl-CoA carboxyltransferase large subunit
MARVTVTELAGTLEQLRAEIANISERMAALEKGHNGARGAVGPVVVAEPAAAAAAPQVRTDSVPAGITEEELLAISAAIGAYLGVRAHIRQIRLLSTNAWAQQGRVSIQASHMLQG